MNINRSGLFWGVFLIGMGLLALAERMGYIDRSSPQVWIAAFTCASLFALVGYALSGWKQWSWLFPAGVFGGLAVTIALASANDENAAVASPLFFGLLLPFAAAYLTDRSRNWWALIPGGMMAFLAGLLLLVDSTSSDEWVGAFFLFMIAAVFLMVYLNNRARTWALIVAYVMAVLGVAPLMSMGGREADYFGPIFLFAVALPFFVVYFRSAENWWAILPAGVMTVLAIITTAAIAGLLNEDRLGSLVSQGYANALLFGGLAATFAVVWLRHARPWAKVVTLVLAAVAIASIFFASFSRLFWPMAIILVGIYLLYTALRPKTV